VDPDDQPDDVVESSVFGADYSTFRSADWWARHWRRTSGVTVTHADMLPNGLEAWQQHARASAAWTGTPVEQTEDGPLLFTGDSTMGFARITAARREGTPLRFGPGRFTTRLA
jgi:hypothetical protein